MSRSVNAPLHRYVLTLKQECIPVGCVLSAAVAIWWVGWWCLPGGWGGDVCVYVSAWEGVYVSAWGVYVSVWGVSARGVSAQGVSVQGGLPEGCTPHPKDRILDTCLWRHYLSATSCADGKNSLGHTLLTCRIAWVLGTVQQVLVVACSFLAFFSAYQALLW